MELSECGKQLANKNIYSNNTLNKIYTFSICAGIYMNPADIVANELLLSDLQI